MSDFVEGIDRSQSTLFPAMLDDYVADRPGGDLFRLGATTT